MDKANRAVGLRKIKRSQQYHRKYRRRCGDHAMSRQRYALSIDLTLLAPYLVHGVDPGRVGLDAVLLCNYLDLGQPIIPGTLLVGRIRDAWRQIDRLQPDTMSDPCKWFGEPST